MTCLAFICSVVITGAIVSLVPLKSDPSPASKNDYHFVPFAGDVWGA